MNKQAKAWEVIDRNTAIIREVVAASQAIVADLLGNADDRRRGSYTMIETERVQRLIAAVDALDSIGPLDK